MAETFLETIVRQIRYERDEKRRKQRDRKLADALLRIVRRDCSLLLDGNVARQLLVEAEHEAEQTT